MNIDIFNKLKEILSDCLVTPSEKENDLENIRLFFSVSFISLFGFLVTLTFGLNAHFQQSHGLGHFLLLMSLVNIGNYFYLRLTKKIVPASFIATLIMISLFFYLLLTGAYQNTGLYWCFVFAPILFFFLGHRNGLIVCVSILTLIVIIFYTPNFPYLSAQYSASEMQRFPIIFGVICLLIFIQEFSRHRVDELNKALTLKLEAVARTDELTGLINRRGAEEALTRELLRAQRSKRYSTLMLVDIDYFKKVNDRYGHDAGDIVLQNVARTLLKVVRDNDYVCRWGGEEFLIILTESQDDSGLSVSERLRRAIENLSIDYQDFYLHVTVSVGVSTFKDKDNINSVLKRTDIALYDAKHSGRNKVVLN